MKFISIFTFMLLSFFPKGLMANNYEAPLVEIDYLVQNACEISDIDLIKYYSVDEQSVKQKNAFVAWILTYSIVGFHRLYLGTKFSTFAAYFITLGGFLIVDIIDYGVLLFALLENKPIDKYVDNPGFFMWN